MYTRIKGFQANLLDGKPNDWQCRAGARYLYICEAGLVHYCSQQRGTPAIPLATYTRDDADSNGFLTLLSDGTRLTGAYAFGPEAGEWLQQATLAVRARVPLDVLRDTMQPFSTFSEVYNGALKALRTQVGSP